MSANRSMCVHNDGLIAGSQGILGVNVYRIQSNVGSVVLSDGACKDGAQLSKRHSEISRGSVSQPLWRLPPAH